jgi:hypothetical protein
MASKYDCYESQIKEIIERNENINNSDIVREIMVDASMQEIKIFSKHIGRHRKRIMDEYEGSYESTNSLDIDNTTVKHLWVKNKEVSAFVKNPNYVEPAEAVVKELDFDSIFRDKVVPIVFDKKEETEGFDKFIYSDVHVGMDVNKDGYALYEGKWDEEEMQNRLIIAVNWIIKHQRFKTLYISDLGDFLDGWDGETTRKGHSLPQNMTNQMAYDAGFRFKVTMIESLLVHYNNIICNNITNDNHSGAFAYIVNSAFKSYIELKYPNNVKVNIQRKFIDHYTVLDKFCFIDCHGKDGGEMKFGFKPQLDDKQITKISNFIDENYLSKKGIIIEFNKGDSHQSLIDKSSSKKFQYHNFPSFALPSNWVKTNFQNSMSGFTFRNYYIDGQMSNHDYIFN